MYHSNDLHVKNVKLYYHKGKFHLTGKKIQRSQYPKKNCKWQIEKDVYLNDSMYINIPLPSPAIILFANSVF